MNTALVHQTTAIETQRPSILQLAAQLPAMQKMAEIYLKAKIINPQLKTEEEVLAVMFKAHELGVSQTYALEKMSVINNGVFMEAELILALIYGSGACNALDIKEAQDSCTVTMTRSRPKIKHSATFKREDAMKAGLLNRDTWIKYPKNMLRWRAITDCARVVFPDVLAGMLQGANLSARVQPSEIEYDSAPQVQEPRMSDDAPPPQNAPSLPPANNEQPASETLEPPKRPYSSEFLKFGLREYAATNKEGNPNKLRKDLELFWGMCLKTTEQNTASFLRQVFGKSEFQDLSQGECNAFLRWLNPQDAPNGEVNFSKYVQVEYDAFFGSAASDNALFQKATTSDNVTIKNAISK